MGNAQKGYNANDYYFEIVEMARKMILTGALVLIEPGSLLQIFLGILVCAGYLAIMIHANPYRMGMDNLLAKSTGAQLFTTLMMGFWITASVDRTELRQAQGGAPTNDPYDESIVAVILLLLYFATIAVLILMLLATFRALFTSTAASA